MSPKASASLLLAGFSRVAGRAELCSDVLILQVPWCAQSEARLGHGAERRGVDELRAVLWAMPPPFLHACRGMLDAYLLWNKAPISNSQCQSVSRKSALPRQVCCHLCCWVAGPQRRDLISGLGVRGSTSGALSGLPWSLLRKKAPPGFMGVGIYALFHRTHTYTAV